MTILFCGDAHGKFDYIVHAALEHDAAAVVLLGDLQPIRPLHVELASIRDRVWFIHGNHDTDSVRDFENVFDCEISDRNIHGGVAVLPDGTRLAGLGGIFRSRVWDPGANGAPRFRTRADFARATAPANRWRGGPERQHWSTIFPDDIGRLGQLRADVLVTHEAGAGHPYGFSVIDDVARSLGVHTSFHGHHHDRLDYSGRWREQGFRSFGVGLGGITDLQGQIIRPGEVDHIRQHRGRRPG